MAILTRRITGGVVDITVTNGGTGYTAPPTVAVVGNGSGAAAVAHMAGTAIESVVITAAGSQYTTNPQVQFSGGGGTGAAATAYAYAGAMRPMTFFKGRYNDMYGVDGMGRGLRWDGDTAVVELLGISKPSVRPSVSASTAAVGKRVTDVQMVSYGSGYNNVPSVVFTGGTPSRSATAKASLTNGRVTSIEVTDGGEGYQDTPVVEITGGIAGGASLQVNVLGKVDDLTIVSQGTGYTGPPSVVFSSAQGLTRAAATVTVVNGRVSSAKLLSGGTGATTSGVTVQLVGGGGTGAELSAQMLYRVSALTVTNGGSAYRSAPLITFRAAPEDPVGSGAAATAVISNGVMTAATVYAGGQYEAIPSAIVLDSTAKATATMSANVAGTYQCCIRYLDDTPESQNGPIPSSISDLTEIKTASGSAGLTWSFNHAGIEDRVTAMELWRTSADQSVILFRVATIQRSDPAFFGSYSDTLSDDALRDTDRPAYGLMPITLPSGQLNARRFSPPPGRLSVAVMFQDRAWYSVDASGERPNSLFFSEIDEPESVPDVNELVLQENVVDPDSIVALIPFGAALLVCQNRHLYRLQYVAQPVIDAAITLVSHRGILNSRCWAMLGDLVFIADSNGMYVFDGNQDTPISVPVDNLWRDRLIDFSVSDVFHVRSDPASQTVRFFYCRTGETLPRRALCYCLATKAWWEEVFASDITAGTTLPISGKQTTVYATGSGEFCYPSGLTDLQGTPVAYEMRTGNMTLVDDKQQGRSIGILYSPTASTVNMNLRLHYNNSPTARPNAIDGRRGGFATVAGSTDTALNLSASASPLGDANGFARAYFSGHRDDRNVGGDRHVALAIAGTQAGTNLQNAVKLYAVTIDGVG